MARVIDVQTVRLYDDPLYGKPMGVRVDQGSTPTLRVPLTSDQSGAPAVVALGNYSITPVVAARFRESTGGCSTVHEAVDCTLELTADQTAAHAVNIPLPVAMGDLPGVFRGQFSLRTADTNEERLRNEFWVLVERGFWTVEGAAPSADRGPPTLAEVRLSVRDHPGANRLLGDYEFDPAEVGFALTSAVQTYNNEFPPLPHQYRLTTINFPGCWRRQLLTGTLAYLFETARAYHRRGHLPYSAGGMSFDDLAKEKDYAAAADQCRQEYVRWVKTQRAKISMDAAWGSLGSGYPTYGTY